MDFNLENKTALITGSSRGIGLAIAQELHRQGCNIALNSRNAIELTNAVSRFSHALGVVGDVSQPNEAKKIVTEVVEYFGGLDILICNVGAGKSVPPGDETAEEWEHIFSQNFWSVTNTVEAARKALIDSSGVIVCISSICGLEVIPGAPLTYSVAKAALNAYVRGIARPLGAHGVRINAIAPGNILFNGSIWANKVKDNQSDTKDFIEREVALKKFGTLQDVADLTVFLASSHSGFATGAIWTLDGGQIRS